MHISGVVAAAAEEKEAAVDVPAPFEIGGGDASAGGREVSEMLEEESYG